MNRLFVTQLTSIGAVTAGDNEPAKIMLWKNRATKEPVPGRKVKDRDSMPEPFDIASLSDEAKTYVTGLQAQLASLTEEPDPIPDDLPDVVKSRMDAQDAQIEKAQVEKDALAKELAEVKDTIADARYAADAASFENILGGDTQDMLKALGQAAPEAYGTLTEQLAKLTTLAGFESVLKEHGDSAATGNAVDQIAAFAKELKKDDPDMSIAQARAQAWRDHPELKELSRQEGN